MPNVRIRTPEMGETPLSAAEQRVAQILRLKPKRVFRPRFHWRDAEKPTLTEARS